LGAVAPRSGGPDCLPWAFSVRRGFCDAAPGCAGSLPTVPRSGQDDAVTGDEVPAYPYAGHRPRLCPHGRLPSARRIFRRGGGSPEIFYPAEGKLTPPWFRQRRAA
jgi:hypothetical protein